MNTQTILLQLKAERDRLNEAINALEGREGNGRRARGYSARTGNGRRSKGGVTGVGNGRMSRGGKPKRRLSAAARKKISEAAKARWAKAKKSGKNSL